MRWPRSIPLLLALLGLPWLAGCESQRELARSHNVLMSTAKEEEVGEEAATAIARTLGRIGNDDVIEYVEDVGERLARNSPRRDVKYRFNVVEMQEPNAFALPGGHIYVSRGLLALANSEEELANVLAHEIAHVALQHHAYRELEVRKTKWLGALAVLAGALAGGPGGAVVAAQGFLIAGHGMLAAYTRDQEREADALGQAIARDAGWDPLAMASFLRSLDQLTRFEHGASRSGGYFDTHPGSLEREANAKVRYEHATPLPDDERGRETYLENVEGIVVGPNPDEGYFQGSRFLHPGLGFTLRFPDGWRTVNEASAVRAVSPRRDAMVILELQGKGEDPEAAAREYAEKTEAKFSDEENRVIHGNAAFRARTVVEVGGKKMKADATWIAHGGAIYRILHVVPPTRLIQTSSTSRTARSFRRLSDSERDGVRVTRLRVAETRPRESIDGLSARTLNQWGRDETALMNGLAVGEGLPEDFLVKVAVPERWVPRPRPEAEEASDAPGEEAAARAEDGPAPPAGDADAAAR